VAADEAVGVGLGLDPVVDLLATVLLQVSELAGRQCCAARGGEEDLLSRELVADHAVDEGACAKGQHRAEREDSDQAYLENEGANSHTSGHDCLPPGVLTVLVISLT